MRLPPGRGARLDAHADSSSAAARRGLLTLLLCCGEAHGIVQRVDVAVQPRRAAWAVRVAARRDLLPVAEVMHDAFAPDGRANTEPTYGSTVYRRSWLEKQLTKLRLAIDIERRLTPWDWRKHRQLVLEDQASGEILGFAEVWAEDRAALGNVTSLTPQPVLFNLCVAEKARRDGAAAALVARCEEHCAAWGEACVFLKVRADNTAGRALYRRAGYTELQERPPADMPDWQTRWKGGALPLILMAKPLPGSALSQITSAIAESHSGRGSAEAGGALDRLQGLASIGKRSPAQRDDDELSISYADIARFNDPDANVWFALCARPLPHLPHRMPSPLRNSDRSPYARLVCATALSSGTWISWHPSTASCRSRRGSSRRHSS